MTTREHVEVAWDNLRSRPGFGCFASTWAVGHLFGLMPGVIEWGDYTIGLRGTIYFSENSLTDSQLGFSVVRNGTTHLKKESSLVKQDSVGLMVSFEAVDILRQFLDEIPISMAAAGDVLIGSVKHKSAPPGRLEGFSCQILHSGQSGVQAQAFIRDGWKELEQQEAGSKQRVVGLIDSWRSLQDAFPDPEAQSIVQENIDRLNAHLRDFDSWPVRTVYFNALRFRGLED